MKNQKKGMIIHMNTIHMFGSDPVLAIKEVRTIAEELGEKISR